MYTDLGIKFITTVNGNNTLKLKGTKTVNSRSEMSWIFRQLIILLKICIRFREFDTSGWFLKCFFERTLYETWCLQFWIDFTFFKAFMKEL